MAASAESSLAHLLQYLGAARDNASDALQSIDLEHYKIHAGDSFVCHYSNTVTNTGEMTVIAFNTPDTARWLHLVTEFSASALAAVMLVEAPSIDVDEGADLPVFNRDRNSARTSEVTTIETVPEANKVTSYDETQAAGANITKTTQIFVHHIGSGAGPFSTGGGQKQRDEYILKQNTQYALIIEALTDDDNVHNIMASWYEHTNRQAV